MIRFQLSFECAQEMVLAVAKVYQKDHDHQCLLSDSSFYRRCKKYKELVSAEVQAAIASGDVFLLGIDGKNKDKTDKEAVFIRILKRDGTSVKVNLFSLAILNFQGENVNGLNLSKAVYDLVNFIGSSISASHQHHNFKWSNIYAISADTTNTKESFLDFLAFSNIFLT